MNFTKEQLQNYLKTYFGIDLAIDFIGNPVDACDFEDYVVAGYATHPTYGRGALVRTILLVSVSKSPNAAYFAHPFFRDVMECKKLEPIK